MDACQARINTRDLTERKHRNLIDTDRRREVEKAEGIGVPAPAPGRQSQPRAARRARTAKSCETGSSEAQAIAFQQAVICGCGRDSVLTYVMRD
jgi:hypothetical protein